MKVGPNIILQNQALKKELREATRRNVRLVSTLIHVRAQLDYDLRTWPRSGLTPDATVWGANMRAFAALTDALRGNEEEKP